MKRNEEIRKKRGGGKKKREEGFSFHYGEILTCPVTIEIEILFL
jgi:hypothetical protein